MVYLHLGFTWNDERCDDVGKQPCTGKQGYENPRQANQCRVNAKILSDTCANAVQLFIAIGLI